MAGKPGVAETEGRDAEAETRLRNLFSFHQKYNVSSDGFLDTGGVD